MNILNLENLSLVLGAKTILDGVNFAMNDREKVGVIGINGTGKSTLLRIAAGDLVPDGGKVTRANGLRISYLSQNPVFDPDRSILENVAARVYGKEAHWNTEGEVRAMLLRFGIPDPDCSPAILSGGQKKRAALVAAVLTPSDLLILDEPTNHLDYEMIAWLQKFLQGYRGALLMVTHDRYFLDEVTDVILELDKGKAYRYEENYSGYLELKQQRLDYEKAAERKMATLYKQDLAWMLRGARARSTKQKAHIQRFEALRDRKKPEEERQVEIASLPSRIGGKTIELDNVSKSYGDRVLFRDFSYTFLKKDRIGIIGPNGCGKSTLIKVILGLVKPDTGTVSIGQTIRFGYFSQENEALDETDRVIDSIRNVAEYIRTPEGLISASEMANRFLFSPEMQYTPVAKLSGGEKRRLYLLRVLMENPNVLILDEPTNDLDIQTLQILEDYLDHFGGIILTVSHDRYFLDRVVTRIFAFQDDGTLWQSEGGYEAYREHLLAAGLDEEGKSAGAEKPERPKATEPAPEEPKKKTKLSYKDQREYDALEPEIDALEQQSQALEEDIAAASSDYGKLKDLCARKEQVDADLEAKMERFLELQDLVDQIGAEKSRQEQF
ncbi:MAG: ABC-F family ATP-binding cassette domain-containing protein [Lachnospiraceae bacterium]|nr:ABC-F family ATP-binding cassette domain-containing protein [Lachnospiraceae bacterium]